MDKKTVLFVAYGGVHFQLLLPIKAKLDELGFNTEILALTTAIDSCKAMGVTPVEPKDLISEADSEIIECGQFLLDKMVGDGANISDVENTIAYMGTSLYDLVQASSSKEEALAKYKEGGRTIFKPKTLVARFFEKYQPDYVIATNVNRAEQVAIELANEQGIPTLQLTDSFGLNEWYSLSANHVCVLNETVRDNLIRLYGVSNDNIVVTGSPYFDDAINHKSSVVEKSDEKSILWFDQLYKTKVENGHAKYCPKTKEETFSFLDKLLAEVSAAGYKLKVRHHPSQSAEDFKEWVADKAWATGNNVELLNDGNLFDVTSSVDMVIGETSTTLINAYNLGKPVIQLNETGQQSFLQINDRKAVEEITSISNLADTIAKLENVGDFDDIFGNGNSVEQIVEIIQQNI